MRKLLFAILLLLFSAGILHAAKPVIFFLDITSGPKTGGQDNKGAFVTVYGRNFGSSQGSSYVTIGGGQADNYPVWGATVDRGPANLDYQKITFQLGTNALTGVVKVYHETEGWNETYYDMYGNSSEGPTFTVRSGNIYFIDTTEGSNGSGTYASPWNTFGTTSPPVTAAYQTMDAGDIVYFRADTITTGFGNTTYTDNVLSLKPSEYNWANGTAENPIAILAYPGEVVHFDVSDSSGVTGGAGGYWDEGFPPYVTIAGFKITSWEQCATSSLPKANETNSFGFRFVGNECDGMKDNESSDLWVGCIGTGRSATILGNQIHGGRTNLTNNKSHAIYISGCNWDADVEVGYNYIYDNDYDNGDWVANNHESDRCQSGKYADNVYYHHNVIDSTTGSSSQASLLQTYDFGFDTGIDPDGEAPTTFIFANLVIGDASDDDAPGSLVYAFNGKVVMLGNTIIADGFDESSTSGVIETEDSNITSARDIWGDTDIKNNIITMGNSTSQHLRMECLTTSGSITVDSNLGYGNSTNPYTGAYRCGVTDSNAVTSDPTFTNSGAKDYSLQEGSPARNAGTDLTSTVCRTDINGNILDTSPNIGAFQDEASSSTTPELVGGKIANGVAQ